MDIHLELAPAPNSVNNCASRFAWGMGMTAQASYERKSSYDEVSELEQKQREPHTMVDQH